MIFRDPVSEKIRNFDFPFQTNPGVFHRKMVGIG